MMSTKEPNNEDVSILNTMMTGIMHPYIMNNDKPAQYRLLGITLILDDDLHPNTFYHLNSRYSDNDTQCYQKIRRWNFDKKLFFYGKIFNIFDHYPS